MEVESLCLEVEPISDAHWDILHLENACCDIKRVPVKLPEETSLASFDKFITENHPTYPYSWFIISNKKTSENDEFLLVERETLSNLRCDVNAVWILLANFSIGNMDFQEYIDWCKFEKREIFTKDMCDHTG